MEEEVDGGVVETVGRGARAVSMCARGTPRMSSWSLFVFYFIFFLFLFFSCPFLSLAVVVAAAVVAMAAVAVLEEEEKRTRTVDENGREGRGRCCREDEAGRARCACVRTQHTARVRLLYANRACGRDRHTQTFQIRLFKRDAINKIFQIRFNQ
jgi:hypothetical protein